jgi:hypothetical protein
MVEIFWDVAPYRYCVNRRFGGTYRFHLQGIKSASEEATWAGVCRLVRGFFYPEEGGDTFLRNVYLHNIYTAYGGVRSDAGSFHPILTFHSDLSLCNKAVAWHTVWTRCRHGSLIQLHLFRVCFGTRSIAAYTGGTESDSRFRIVYSEWKFVDFLGRLRHMPRQYLKID